MWASELVCAKEALPSDFWASEALPSDFWVPGESKVHKMPCK